MTQRTDRINELLQQEIGDLITREIADPAVGFVTITDVETSPDLRHARVWVSVIGQPDARRASVQALQRAMPFVRAQLGRRLRLKRIPEFSVRLDDSAERGSRVLQLLNEIEAGGEPDELVEGESLPTPGALHPRDEDESPAGRGESPEAVAPPASRRGAGRPSSPARGRCDRGTNAGGSGRTGGSGRDAGPHRRERPPRGSR